MDGGHERNSYVDIYRQEDAPELHLEIEEVDKVHIERVGEEHSSTSVMLMASVSKPSPPKVGHTLILFIASGPLFISSLCLVEVC